MIEKVKWSRFLLDVFWCSLSSYGGPEAHYGIFSSMLVEKKKYIKETELTEMIGLYAIVPGPSSTQTITSIGYHVGGPILALLTFLVWALPAIIIMGSIGVFFSLINEQSQLEKILTYLPAVAVGFIIYAAIKLTTKVVKNRFALILYGLMLVVSLLIVRFSMWFVPVLLISGGIIIYLKNKTSQQSKIKKIQANWWILGGIVSIAVMNELLVVFFDLPMITLFTSFYRYGYSVIGGGQIVIPLMIQDLVQSQGLISLSDFLAGYAIDQAIPGPLFSFAAFVASRSYQASSLSFVFGMLGGLTIFLPGILLVMFIYPIWKRMRGVPNMKHFLSGVSITAASLIAMTAITQVYMLPFKLDTYIVLVISTILLLSKKVPAPIVVVIAIILGWVL